MMVGMLDKSLSLKHQIFNMPYCHTYTYLVLIRSYIKTNIHISGNIESYLYYFNLDTCFKAGRKMSCIEVMHGMAAGRVKSLKSGIERSLWCWAPLSLTPLPAIQTCNLLAYALLWVSPRVFGLI